MKYVAYVFLDRTRDWECAVTPFHSDFDGDLNWYLVGGVNNLKELFQLMEEHGFDAEYFYEYVDHCMSHPLYNMLNKEAV